MPRRDFTTNRHISDSAGAETHPESLKAILVVSGALYLPSGLAESGRVHLRSINKKPI